MSKEMIEKELKKRNKKAAFSVYAYWVCGMKSLIKRPIGLERLEEDKEEDEDDIDDIDDIAYIAYIWYPYSFSIRQMKTSCYRWLKNQEKIKDKEEVIIHTNTTKYNLTCNIIGVSSLEVCEIEIKRLMEKRNSLTKEIEIKRNRIKKLTQLQKKYKIKEEG